MSGRSPAVSRASGVNAIAELDKPIALAPLASIARLAPNSPDRTADRTAEKSTSRPISDAASTSENSPHSGFREASSVDVGTSAASAALQINTFAKTCLYRIVRLFVHATNPLRTFRATTATPMAAASAANMSHNPDRGEDVRSLSELTCSAFVSLEAFSTGSRLS